MIGDGKVTLFDGFCMTCITVTTIGYAESVDLSGNIPGRLFTVAIAITGLGCL